MKLSFVTTNKKKVEILQRYLQSTDVQVVQEPLELVEPRGDDVTDVARLKALEALRLIKHSLVVLDAGFFIHTLNGFPGPYMKMATSKLGLENILKMVAGQDRKCTFRKCLAYVSPKIPEPRLFVATAEGIVAESPRGTDAEPAPFNRLFIPMGYSRALTELSPEDQVAWYAGLRLYNNAGEDFTDWLNQHYA